MNFNSYLGMAESDYLFAKSSLDNCRQIGLYNPVAALLSQAAEKYLKAVIEKLFADDSDSIRLLKSHNLRSLFTKIKSRYPGIKIDAMECKWLGDFYFDARYPGDDFVEVPESDALKCVEIAETIRRECLMLLNTHADRKTVSFSEFQRLKPNTPP